MITPASLSPASSRPSYSLSVTEATPPRRSLWSLNSTPSNNDSSSCLATETLKLPTLPLLQQSDLVADWDEAFLNFSSAEYPPSSLGHSSNSKYGSSEQAVPSTEQFPVCTPLLDHASSLQSSAIDKDRNYFAPPSAAGEAGVVVDYDDSKSTKSATPAGGVLRKRDIDARPLPMKKPPMSDELKTMLHKVEAIQAGLNGHPLLSTAYHRSNPSTPQRSAYNIEEQQSQYRQTTLGQTPTKAQYLTPDIQRVLSTTPQKPSSARSRRSIRSLFSLPGTPRKPKPSPTRTEERFDVGLRLPATDAEMKNLSVMNRAVAVMQDYSKEMIAGLSEDQGARQTAIAALVGLLDELRVGRCENNCISYAGAGGC